MPINFRPVCSIALLLCLLLTTQITTAGTQTWQYSITPYLWNVSFDGNTSSGDNDFPIDVDYSFFTLDNLDNVLSLNFEANNGRFGILFDGLRARYSDSASNRLFDTTLAVELGYLEGAVSYTPSAFDNVDIIGGVRYFFLDTQVQFNPGPATEGDYTWTDPLVGLRYQDNLTNNWRYQLRGDVGGFGVSSDLVLNLLGAIRYSFNKTFTAELGYRYLSIDFTEDDFLYDVSMHGLVVGLGIHF
jgi:hypothetical protein